MGGIISRLRAKPSTKEVLEELEKEIDSAEEYKRSTEQQQKKVIGSLIFYFILFFLMGAGLFLFYYFPQLTTTKDKVIYALPLGIVPVVCFLLKRFLHWYFVQKIKYNDENLLQLKRRRRSIIELAMNTETYKVVKELLEKFDPEYHKQVFETRAIEAPPPPVPIKGTFADLEVRKRASPVKSTGVPHVAPGQTLTLNTGAARSPVPQMPRPVLPRERTVIDRIVDYMVGDGPSNRYALICRQCQSHNGMALREEFEFVAFRCCYCFHWNPPRTQQAVTNIQSSDEVPQRLALQDGNSPPLVTELHSGSDTSGSSAEEVEEITQSPDGRRSPKRGSQSPSLRRRLNIDPENEIHAKLEEDVPNHLFTDLD